MTTDYQGATLLLCQHSPSSLIYLQSYIWAYILALWRWFTYISNDLRIHFFFLYQNFMHHELNFIVVAKVKCWQAINALLVKFWNGWEVKTAPFPHALILASCLSNIYTFTRPTLLFLMLVNPIYVAMVLLCSYV